MNSPSSSENPLELPESANEALGTSGVISRRSLVEGAAGAAVVLAFGGTVKAIGGAAPVLRPPGAIDEAHFIGTCIRCNRCRGACPRDAIVNCDFEDGIINIRTPRLHFHTKSSRAYRRAEGMSFEDIKADPYPGLLAAGGIGYCDFCNLCIENCPTGALQAFDPTARWIGGAVVDPTYCIAFEKMGGCRKCADYCPFDAISINDDRRPVVDLARCNGCGVCENICPSASYRSFKGSTRRGINVDPTEQERPL